MQIKREAPRQIYRKIYALLEKKQRRGFLVILLILGVSAVLSQITPLAVGYLTDDILAQQDVSFSGIWPVLVGILVVNVVNEVIKVIRRLIVEDTATPGGKERPAEGGAGAADGARWPIFAST